MERGQCLTCLYAARSLCRLKSLVALSGKTFLSTKVARGAQRVNLMLWWTSCGKEEMVMLPAYAYIYMLDSNVYQPYLHIFIVHIFIVFDESHIAFTSCDVTQQ